MRRSPSAEGEPLRWEPRDPNTFAVIALVSICDECVAEFAERLAQESLEGPPPH